MVEWELVYTKEAIKDSKKIKEAGLKPKVKKLLTLLKKNPFLKFPPYEKLVGDLKGVYSRRITIQHRLVYQVIRSERTVKIIRMWTHYE